MKDEDLSRDELLAELVELRCRVEGLEVGRTPPSRKELGGNEVLLGKRSGGGKPPLQASHLEPAETIADYHSAAQSASEAIGVTQDQRLKSANREETQLQAYSEDGLQMVGTALHITDHGKAEEALSESENRLTKLMDHSPMGMAVADMSGEIKYLNKKFIETFGYTLQDIPTLEHWWRLAYPDPQNVERVKSEWLHTIRESAEEGTEPDPVEREVRCKDGTVRIIDFRKTVVDKLIIHTLHDVTESKRQEEALRESEQMFRLLSEQSLMSVAILQGGAYKYVNQAMSDLCGYSLEEISEWGPEELLSVIHSDDRSLVEAQARMEQSEAPCQKGLYSFRIITKSNTTKWVEVYSKTIQFKGRPANLLTMLDITERVKAEEDLRSSEERLRLAWETSPDALSISRLEDGTYVDANQGYTFLTGYTRDEVIGRSALDLPFWADAQDRQPFAAYLKQHGHVRNFETRLRRKDGEIRSILLSAGVMMLHGEPHLLAVTKDIEDMKRAEKALARSEELFRKYFELGLVGMALTSPEKGWVFVNDRICEMLGYTRDELLQTTWPALTHPDDLGPDLMQFDRMLAGQIDGYAMDKRFIRKNGETVDTTAHVSCIRRADGSVEHVIAHLHDITDRKKVENELFSSSQMLQLVLDTIPQRVFWKDRNSVYVGCNKPLAEDGGYSDPADLIGKTDYETTSWATADLYRADDRQVMETGQPKINYEEPQVRADGSVGWLRTSKMPLRDKDGRVIGVLGTFEDITERKRAEQALREASLVVENSPVVLFRWRATQGWPITMVSKNVEQFGYVQEELLSGEVPFASMVHPEDLDRVAREIEEYSSTGAVRFQQEYRIVTKEGIVRWVDDRTLVERNDQDEVVSYEGILIDVTERKLAEGSLSEKTQFISSLLRAIPVAVFYKDKEGRYVGCNDAFARFMGVDSEEICGKTVHELWPGELAEKYHQMDLELMRNREHQEYEFQVEAEDGQKHPVIFAKDVFLDTNGEVAGLVGAFLDITDIKLAETERERLQEQLLQSQKMESVARLAGGVAHDFNNVLSAILGHAQLGMMRCKPSDKVHTHLEVIEESAYRSADLVRQLLAFARRQTVAPKIVDVNDTVAGLLKMLLRLIGEDIDLVWMPGTCLWPVKIDPSQFDQIMANLCINARDAISGVGKVTIETENTSFDDSYCAVHQGFVCGDYVMLAVSDDGCGMSKEVLYRIFEPFFTTKELGKGTGLGLSTVYGIVKQNDGFINVYSEPGKGTTFKVYLPRFVGETIAPTAETTRETARSRGELVLLVEDEPVILNVGKQMLEELGYKVLTAATPGEALRQAREHTTEIQLLITDVVMPEMNGRDLAKSMQDIIPGLQCLFTSGYTSNVIAHRGVLDEDVHFIQKPFSLQDLAGKVREALERE
jgi:PAS domain S-box-containing protein